MLVKGQNLRRGLPVTPHRAARESTPFGHQLHLDLVCGHEHVLEDRHTAPVLNQDLVATRRRWAALDGLAQSRAD